MTEFEGTEIRNKERLKQGNSHIKTLGDLYEVLLNCWSRETAYPSDQPYWTTRCPSIGQCAITAMLVYDMFGGEMYRAKNHYYNKIDGHWVDLTARQFWDFNEQFDYTSGRKVYRNRTGQSGHTKKRYDLLVRNITEYLNRI